MALSTAFFGCISLICGLWDRSGRQQHFIARLWARTMLMPRLLPRPGHRRGKAQARHRRRLRLQPPQLHGHARPLRQRSPSSSASSPSAGLWKIPFVGWYLHRSGQVPIDASSPRSAIAGLLRGVAALKSGLPLFVFPEGARSPTATSTPWPPAAAFMAIRAGVPLVPLALVGTYELLPIHVYALRPRPLKLIVGDPIPTTGLTTRDADALTARLYAEISATYYAHSDLTPAAAPPPSPPSF